MKTAQDVVIGDYTNLKASSQMNARVRNRIVRVICHLVERRNYKKETQYIAISIADRYLHFLISTGKMPLPEHILLATSSVTIAAKLEEPVDPLFSVMRSYLPSKVQHKVKSRDLVILEQQILTRLEFSL